MHFIDILSRNNASFSKVKDSVIFVNRKTIKLINNFGNIYFHWHLYLCVQCNRYRNLLACNTEIYLFCLEKCTQFNEMYHTRDGANANGYIWISLIYLRKRSTFYRINRIYICESSSSTMMFLILQLKTIANWSLKFSFVCNFAKLFFGQIHMRIMKSTKKI